VGLPEAGRKGGETVSQTKSICKRLARKADKRKIRYRTTETKFLKAITRSYVFFFFIGAQKELRITRLNAS
jgi:hypothetical protein